MEFREFIELDEAELFDAGLESMDEWLDSALKFVAGATGNALSQTGRSVGNIVGGVAQGAYGLGQGALSAAQRASGGREEAGETCRRSGENLGSGLGKIATGLAQGLGVATVASPIMRGAQAVTEPVFSISGVYAPASGKRTRFQDIMGLDSWDKPKPPSEDKPEEKPAQAPKPRARSSSRTKRDPAAKFLKNLERHEKESADRDPSQPKPQPEEWQRLVGLYKAARTKEERDDIKRQMASCCPYLFQQAVMNGLKKKIARRSM